MKYIISIILLIPFLLSAQAEKNDPKATELLETVSKKINSYSTLEIDFELALYNPEKEEDIQKGVMLQTGDMYKLDLPSQLFINDGKEMYVVFKEDNSAQLNTVEEGMGSMGILNPKEFINLYKSGEYIYAITGEEKINDRAALWQIEFKPKDRYSEYSKIRLTINKDTELPQYLKIFNKDGSRITVTLNKIDYNKVIDEGIFKFDKSKYPGIVIEDLRID